MTLWAQSLTILLKRARLNGASEPMETKSPYKDEHKVKQSSDHEHKLPKEGQEGKLQFQGRDYNHGGNGRMIEDTET
jgi:hypothetical protein